jgi:phosphotransferase system HPr-like phosphotransfer protein
LAAGPSAAFADWRSAFAEGIKAYDLGEWGEVESYMKKAIDEKPTATGEKVRVYGMKFERYLPYYYLGVALYHQKRCQEALAEFARSRAAGQVGSLGKSNMMRQEEECRRKLGLPPPSATPPPPPPTAAPVNRRRSSRPPPSSTPPPPSSASPTTPPRPPARPPTTQRPPAPPAFDPPSPAKDTQTTEEVKDEVLKEKLETVQERVFRPAEAWVNAVDDYLRGLGREPTWAEHYRGHRSTLNSARALATAAASEGDVHAVEEAGRRGQEALKAIQDLARKLGIRPP